MNKLAFLAVPATILLAGCGGNSSTPVMKTQTTPYAGSYAANLTSPAASAVLVVLQTDGSATVVVANANGILASGTGTVNDNTLNVSTSGTGGNIQVDTTFTTAKTPVSQLTGAATDSNVSDTMIAGPGQSPFAGHYTSAFVGTNSGSASMMITESGGLSGSGKTTDGTAASFVGASQIAGLLAFTGSIKISNVTVTSSFSGSLFVTDVTVAGARVMGSGTWKDTKGGSGTWTASNIIG
jgi:hypothetical protein